MLQLPAHGGAQSALPATKSARRGSHSCNKICSAMASNLTATASNLRQYPQTYERWPPPKQQRPHMEVHKVLRLPRHLHMEVHKVLHLPRRLHMEVHKSSAPATKSTQRFTKCCTCHEICTWSWSCLELQLLKPELVYEGCIMSGV